MATPQHKNPCQWGHESYNFGRPFLDLYHFILSLSDLCLGVKKKIFKEKMHFHYMTHMVTPQQKNPCPGVMKFTILIDPSLVTITIHFDCLNHAPEQRGRFFNKYINFTIFTSKLPPLGMGRGHEINNYGLTNEDSLVCHAHCDTSPRFNSLI